MTRQVSDRIVVIGGGAAGMMAAITAARLGSEVLLVEQMQRCGRKLRSEEAKQRGMGSVCYQKWLAQNNRKKLFKISSLHSPKNSV